MGLCFVIYYLFASRAIWKPFYRRLRFRVVLTVRKMGRLGTMSKLAIIAVKGSVDNLSFPSMLLESQISSQPLAKRLILNFFHQSFLSRDAYDRAPGRNVINGRSNLTSQRNLLPSGGRAQCITSVIASSTVGGSLGPFDRDKARQNETRAPRYLHTTERPSSLTPLLLGPRCFLNTLSLSV